MRQYYLTIKLLGATILLFGFNVLRGQDADIRWFERVTNTDSIGLVEIIQHPELLIPVNSNSVNHGVTNQTCWIISEPLPFLEAHYLWINNPVLGEIDFYLVDGNKIVSERKTGFLKPFGSREIVNNGFVFSIPSTKGQQALRIILKVKSQEALAVPLRVMNSKALETGLFNNQTIIFVVLGVVGALFLLYTVIFLFLREKDYLFYLIYAACSFLVVLKIEGLAFAWLWPNHPSLNNFSAITDTLVTFSGGIFSYQFLRIRKYYPILSYLFIACIALQAVAFSIACFGHNSLAISIASGVSPFFMVFSIIGALLVLIIKKYRPAKYYLIGWPILYVGAIVYILKSFGVIASDNLLIVHALEIAMAAEMLILAVGVSRSIDQLRIEKEIAQHENIAMVEKQKELLEEKVFSRTLELEAQNEELRQQQEELTAHREVIFKQNIIIQNHNESLETKIEKQTEELQKSNQELADHNSQLEQFAYVTAHNLRSPVARLLGLANLLELKKVLIEDSETKNILDKIISSSQNLDSIIHDLNRILELRREYRLEASVVFFHALMDRIKESLGAEIQNSACLLEFDFENLDSITTFKPYLESIIFNLISNSIKYRNPEKNLSITVRTGLENEWNVITVKDNGLGLNMEKYGNKVFSLYKRFHSHVDGKGMGLFLVKTQLKILKGDIKVVSSEGNGMEISVYLPRVN